MKSILLIMALCSAVFGQTTQTSHLSQATGDKRYVKKAGDTMTGPLTLAGSSLTVRNAVSGAGGWNETSLLSQYPALSFGETTGGKYSRIGNNADGGLSMMVNGTVGVTGTERLAISPAGGITATGPLTLSGSSLTVTGAGPSLFVSSISIGAVNLNAELSVSNSGKEGVEIDAGNSANVVRYLHYNRGTPGYVKMLSLGSEYEWQVGTTKVLGIDTAGAVTIPGSSFSVGGSTLSVSAGRVGVGTEAPYTSLQITDAADPIIRMVDTAGTSNKKTFEIRTLGDSGFEGLQFRGVNDANSVYSSLMFLKENGNVGISTTAPSISLDVQGQIGPKAYTLAQMNVLVPGRAGAMISVSDASAPYSYCVSTGTAAGAWVQMHSPTTHCQ